MNEFEQHEQVQAEKLPQEVTEEMAAGMTEIADKLRDLRLSSVLSVIHASGRHFTIVVGNRRRIGTLVSKLAEQLP